MPQDKINLVEKKELLLGTLTIVETIFAAETLHILGSASGSIGIIEMKYM